MSETTPSGGKAAKPAHTIVTFVRREIAANRGLMRDMLPTLATRAFAIAAGLLTSVITAHALGPGGRGEYFYVVTLAQLATQFGHLGLASSNTYAIAREPATLARLAANSLWVSTAVGMLAALGCLVVEATFGTGDRVALSGVLFVLVPSLIYGLLAANILIGLGLISKYNHFVVVSTGLQLIGVLAVWLVGGGPAGMLWVSAGASLFAACVLFWALYRIGGTRWTLDIETLRKNIGFSSRVYVATLVPFIVARLNVVMIDWWSSPEEMGYYSISVQLFDTLMVLPSTAAMLLFPELIKRGPEGALVRTVRVTAAVSLLMMIAVALVAAAAPFALPALFGQAFSPTVVVLWWILPGLVAFSVLNVVSQYLASEGLPASNLWAWISGVPVLASLGSVLIPQYGASGAAMALSATYTLLAAALVVAALMHNTRHSRVRDQENN